MALSTCPVFKFCREYLKIEGFLKCLLLRVNLPSNGELSFPMSKYIF
jgi:hypothetical protein